MEPQQTMTESITKRMQNISYTADLYADIPTTAEENHVTGAMSGQMLITSAPEVESPSIAKTSLTAVNNDANALVQPVGEDLSKETSEPKKKKYAKEAWPGKKPAPNLLSV